MQFGVRRIYEQDTSQYIEGYEVQVELQQFAERSSKNAECSRRWFIQEERGKDSRTSKRGSEHKYWSWMRDELRELETDEGKLFYERKVATNGLNLEKCHPGT